MSAKFGWSLPPGCTTLPGEEPERMQPRCRCGSFLAKKPDRIEQSEEGWNCPGTPVGNEDDGFYYPCGANADHDPHKEIEFVGTIEYRTCKKCGEETQTVT